MPSPADEVARALARAEIHYSDYGLGQLHWQHWVATHAVDAPPLILLHGGFGSWNHWFKNVPGLQRHRDVWTVDLPGLGQSGDMPEPHSCEHFASILLRGLNELLGPEATFALAGFSFGAMIAGELARQAGSRCRRCTLIGAVGFGELQVQVSLIAPPDPETAPASAQAVHRENLRRLMLSRPDVIDDLAVYLHGDNLARHRFRSRRIALSNDLADILPKISAPLVGLWGAQDATAGGLDALEARRALFQQAQRDAAFHVLPGVGHWAMYEAPVRVNEVLLEDLP